MIDLKKNVAYVRKWIIIKQQKTVATNNIIQHGWASKHAKWKNPNTKGHTVYNFISIKCPERDESKEIAQAQVCKSHLNKALKMHQ